VVSPSITRGHRYETKRRHGMLSIGPTLTNIKVGRPVSDWYTCSKHSMTDISVSAAPLPCLRLFSVVKANIFLRSRLFFFMWKREIVFFHETRGEQVEKRRSLSPTASQVGISQVELHFYRAAAECPWIVKWLFWKQIIISIARWASVSHHILWVRSQLFRSFGLRRKSLCIPSYVSSFFSFNLSYIISYGIYLELKKTNFGLVTSHAQRLSGSSRHQVGSPNKEGRTSVHSVGDLLQLIPILC
jgi:hypothetical protein